MVNFNLPEPQRNRKTFNKDQYCTSMPMVYTVLVIIKLTKFAVAVRFCCGCSKLTSCLYFIIYFRFLRTLFIV